jgi:hypothetical protein
LKKVSVSYKAINKIFLLNYYHISHLLISETQAIRGLRLLIKQLVA